MFYILRSIHRLEVITVTIATSVAAGGLGGVIPEEIHGMKVPFEKIGALADIMAGVICAYKVWTHKRKEGH